VNPHLRGVQRNNSVRSERWKERISDMTTEECVDWKYNLLA
jgi:hypothetical protein